MTKLEKALENIEKVKRIIMENSCPSEFGLENHCSANCELCWSREFDDRAEKKEGATE